MNQTKPQIIDFLEKLLETEFIQVKFAPQLLYESSININSTKYYLDQNDNLKALQIQGTEIEDISFFNLHSKHFQDLNILNLSFNKIKNCNHLSKLKSITALNISNNQIKDIDFVSNFKILRWLNIDNNNEITKNKPLPFLKDISKISLQFCNLTNLFIVSKLENLKELNLSNNKLKNITGIEKFKKLKILKLSYNNLTDIEQIKQLNELEIIELNNNKLNTFPNILDLKYLSVLNIKNNQIKAIPNISIENTAINAQNNPFSNIYLFQDPSKAVINVNWLTGKLKSIIEEVGNEKGAMLGIFGKWGRGKSYFWNILKQKLSENKKYEIVEFIAWKYNDTSATQAYLYETIASVYFKKPETPNKFFNFLYYLLKRFLYNFSRHREKVIWQLVIFIILPLILIYGLSQNTLKIEFISKIFGDFGYFGIIGTYIVYLYYYFTKFNKLNISNILKESSIQNFESYLGLQSTIEKELQFIFQRWNKKVVLFIDDLDRCTEDKMLQIIDSLRVITENKYIYQKLTIIAAVDERILRRVIYNKYKPLVENKEQLLSLTREYLEKLFIFGIKLPSLTENEKREIFDNYTRNQQLMFGIVKTFASKDYKQNIILDQANFEVFANKLKKTDITPRQIRNIYNRFLLAIELITELGNLDFDTENILKELLISLVISFTFDDKPEEIYKNLEKTDDDDKEIEINVLEKKYKFLKKDWKKIFFVVEHVVPY